MARGRPPGTKNKSSHSAGGDRRSSKYKKQQAAKQARGRQHIADAFANARRQQLETPQWKEHPLSKNNFEASQKLLAKVLDHPSMPKGKSVPTRGIIDQRSDNWDISYDIPSTTNEEESDGFYRRVLIPPAGTPLRTYLDEAKAHIEKNEFWRRRQYYVTGSSSKKR
ncbi:unnamed protein product [Cylindrotheca closterium]|uniref:Uncharacterized protein n=1 Tax=Cylindrotheca closterium TaxID=2856 RepID=A0AAD2CJT1_9STRA|nr:unnamed protein product [Cylindrotheca closterium]